MAAYRGSDDAAFSWPPTDSDLAVIDVVSTTLVSTSTAAAPTGASRPVASRLRPVGYTRGDGLLLLAAGMLLGSAVPSLDTGPPTRIGLQAATALPVVELSSIVTPAKASAPPALDVPTTEPVSASTVFPRSSGTGTPPVAAGTRAPLRTDARSRQVVAVLQTYGRAWSRMDARAARAAMPSADVDALTRTFTALREQKLTLSACRVSGTGSTATASCTATRRYRPRQGDHSTRVERGRWHFRVVRTAQRWVIAGVDRS